MKTTILKSTMVVVAMTVSGLGIWKVYDNYGTKGSSLIVENIEALTDPDIGAYEAVKCYNMASTVTGPGPIWSPNKTYIGANGAIGDTKKNTERRGRPQCAKNKYYPAGNAQEGWCIPR